MKVQKSAKVYEEKIKVSASRDLENPVDSEIAVYVFYLFNFCQIQVRNACGIF